MKAGAVVGLGAIVLAVATPAFAHRLDEYLQATTIAVERDRVRTELRLTPGVEVFPVILAAIDRDRNGVFSDTEQHRYVEHVRRDLMLSLDGDRLELRPVSSRFPTIQEMSHGLGSIVLAFESDVLHAGTDRTLIFENRHMSGIAVYLVNGLVPTDPDIRAGAQRRDRRQSHYELDYMQSGAAPATQPTARLASALNWVGLTALTLIASVTLLRRRRLLAARHPKA